jgi:predicted methyltransferase
MIIHLAIKHKLITVDLSGAVNDLKVLNDNRITKNKINSDFKPNKNLNQFPCNEASRYRKAKLIKERYPFAEYLRFAIIGDDDLISLYFQQENIIPFVIESDNRITDLITKNNSNAIVFKIDLTDEKAFLEAKIPSINTFITDPPYTYHGALLFILKGLILLSSDENIKEFYVILNEQMIGKNLHNLQNTLFLANVYLYKTIDNFCQYEIPENFDERTRANKFLKTIKVSNQSVKYSSSSNLYIFRTVKPNIVKLAKEVDVIKIYNHYAEI